jgi:tetratricopeptide (TPR) repeat protein
MKNISTGRGRVRNIFSLTLIISLVGCAAPLTQTVWVPIDSGQRPYFSQINAQCNIYAQNVAAGINMPSTPSTNKGNAAAQAFLGGLYIALSRDDAYNECMYAAGWQLQTQLTAAGVSNNYYQKALNFFKNKQWSDLEALTYQWTTAQPNNSTAYAFRANAYLGVGEYQLALTNLDKSISLGSKDAAVYANRGLVKQSLKRFGEAFDDFNQCLSIDRSNQGCIKGLVLAQLALGREYLKRNDIQSAIKYLEPASDAGNSEAQNDLAVALLKLKNPPDKAVLDRAMTLYKNAANQGNIYAKYNLGSWYLNGNSSLEKNVDQGLSLWEAAARGGHPEAQFWYAMQFAPWGKKPSDQVEQKMWLELAVNNKQSTPDQINRAKAALSRLEPPPTPKWINAINTNCRIWNSRPLPDEKVEWNGACVNGVATGFGTAKWILPGGSYQAVTGTYQDGKRADGAGETIDTRYNQKITGTIVNGKWNGPAQRTNLQTGAVTKGTMIDSQFTPTPNSN